MLQRCHIAIDARGTFTGLISADPAGIVHGNELRGVNRSLGHRDIPLHGRSLWLADRPVVVETERVVNGLMQHAARAAA